MGYGPGDRKSLFKVIIYFVAGTEIFSSASCRKLLGLTQPLSPELKWLGREAGCSSPFSVEVKNLLKLTSTCPYNFMEFFLIRHRNNFTYCRE